jgi:hypothetical protein
LHLIFFGTIHEKIKNIKLKKRSYAQMEHINHEQNNLVDRALHQRRRIMRMVNSLKSTQEIGAPMPCMYFLNQTRMQENDDEHSNDENNDEKCNKSSCRKDFFFFNTAISILF